MKIKNKVGYCDNRVLNLRDKKGRIVPGGHYVYIREDNKDGTCNVNIITSLEKDGKFTEKKLHQVRKGNTYAIPIRDANFKLWSGVKKDAINNVPVIEIVDIDNRKINYRHRLFINKFMK